MDRDICVSVIRTSYMRQKELLTLIPFSPATLWRKVKAGTFVKPVKLSARITAWNRAEVYEWLNDRGGRL
jgi:predicted DNA-binding transcriptional regulator AlpA